jgi:hypothetical protein
MPGFGCQYHYRRPFHRLRAYGGGNGATCGRDESDDGHPSSRLPY